MLRVALQPEPARFDAKVRQPGRKWLRRKAIGMNGPPPAGSRIPSFWTRCLSDLYQSYNGICAYSSRRIPEEIGGHSTDHFIPKSRLAGQIYEWTNYRLCSRTINSYKNAMADCIDPFTIPSDLFRLTLETGHIYVNSNYKTFHPILYDSANKTITTLKLDSPAFRTGRKDIFDHYQKIKPNDLTYARDWLKKESPFIHAEVIRQGV